MKMKNFIVLFLGFIFINVYFQDLDIYKGVNYIKITKAKNEKAKQLIKKIDYNK